MRRLNWWENYLRAYDVHWPPIRYDVCTWDVSGRWPHGCLQDAGRSLRWGRSRPGTIPLGSRLTTVRRVPSLSRAACCTSRVYNCVRVGRFGVERLFSGTRGTVPCSTARSRKARTFYGGSFRHLGLRRLHRAGGDRASSGACQILSPSMILFLPLVDIPSSASGPKRSHKTLLRRFSTVHVVGVDFRHPRIASHTPTWPPSGRDRFDRLAYLFEICFSGAGDKPG